MHSTYTQPRLTPPVTPTRNEVAVGRANLLRLADNDIKGRDAFLVGYLDSILHSIAGHVIDPAAREQIVRALALIEAHNELCAEEAAFYTPRSDTPAFDPTTVPHEGIKCGRYAR